MKLIRHDVFYIECNDLEQISYSKDQNKRMIIVRDKEMIKICATKYSEHFNLSIISKQ